ncbi:unnamed protein product [Acanthosepion pharaonis]|uniref:Uncharacterized protein n=1 Tax=Acanthosepion pharaonis TaxID=158019 RepID=A0A812APW5_ACAPH|nr:unnamed protein product [Sepia pharaonis]
MQLSSLLASLHCYICPYYFLNIIFSVSITLTFFAFLFPSLFFSHCGILLFISYSILLIFQHSFCYFYLSHFSALLMMCLSLSLILFDIFWCTSINPSVFLFTILFVNPLFYVTSLIKFFLHLCTFLYFSMSCFCQISCHFLHTVLCPSLCSFCTSQFLSLPTIYLMSPLSYKYFPIFVLFLTLARSTPHLMSPLSYQSFAIFVVFVQFPYSCSVKTLFDVTSDIQIFLLSLCSF